MTSLYVNALLCTLHHIVIDPAVLHRVFDQMLQRAQKCLDVQEGYF
jgi:hypothetical protein